MSGRKVYPNSMIVSGKRYEEQESQTPVVNKPEKAKNAYLWFCKDMMENLKMNYPESSQQERFIIQGQYWESLSMEDRGYWIDLAMKDKERYERELSIYGSIK